MRESDMQTLFRDYIKSRPPEASEVYELKICKSTSLGFDAVKPHQIEALLDAEKYGLFHKITDPPIFYGGEMRFNVPRPFDCMYLKNTRAFVILWFYVPRKPKIFYKIHIDKWLELKASADRKSITPQMAKEIAEEELFINKKHDRQSILD